MEEVWKDIEGFEGLYQVSNMGRVKSLDRYVTFIDGRIRHYDEKILKGRLKDNGYIQVSLYKDSKHIEQHYIHRLVAQAFIHFVPQDNVMYEIDHRNTNKQDNRVCNLCWVTRSQNLLNPITRKKSSISRTGKKLKEEWKNSIIKSCGKSVYCVETGKVFTTMTEAADFAGVTPQGIYAALKHTNGCKTAGGYHWRYVDEQEKEA